MTLPDKAAILAWIRDNPRNATKRDIARAFDVHGAERVELKRLLRELAEEGATERRAGRHRPAGHLPPVAVLVGAGLSLREAMPWANKAGGYVVGKLGTATVSHAELFGAAAPV
jgi:ribonuclease R